METKNLNGRREEGTLLTMSKSYGNLIHLIIERSNMEDAFDEVVGDLGEERRKKYGAKKERIIKQLQEEIASGKFRIKHFKEFEVKEGKKIRKIQSPIVRERIGCNAIMRIVEKFVYPTVIKTSAASIKGRGMHKLAKKLRRDVENDREGTRFYYQSDIRKFYESIDQLLMTLCIERYIKDKVLLPILKSFITLMEHGLSIGLRSSQCYGNLYLSIVDHYMKEVIGVKYYYRYCDDIVMLAGTKKEIWRYRNALWEQIGKLNLEIKPSEAVRPISEGIDFLGFVYDGEKARIRKHTKQKAARALKRVKSRKRRQRIIGSFKGMAKWGDCSNLYYQLTGKKMKDFKEFNLQYVAEDGKKRFAGQKVSQSKLVNLELAIEDFETDVQTPNGNRTVVSFTFLSGPMQGQKAKYFTDDKQQLQFLQKIQEMGGLPFKTTLQMDSESGAITKYIFT